MRRWLYWRLNALVEFLDDNVYRLRALADKLDPGFRPRDYDERASLGHRITEEQMRAEVAESGGIRLGDTP